MILVDFLDKLVPNGSDESLSATDYEKKLKDSLEPEIKELRESIAKVKKEGLSLETLPLRKGLDPLVWLMGDLLTIVDFRLKDNYANKLRSADEHLGAILKTLQSYKKMVDKDGKNTSMSDINMTKTRLALHVISNYYTVYMDATNVSNMNLIECMHLVIKTIKPLRK